MTKHKYDCVATLQTLGISYDDATALRRISMTLHRWHELECGSGNDYASWAIVRGRIERSTDAQGSKTLNFIHDENGAPYLETHKHSEQKPVYTKLVDRERGALRRLDKILTNGKYPTLTAYVQTDPRGAALYILRPGDVPAGENADSYYSRGIAVCR